MVFICHIGKNSNQNDGGGGFTILVKGDMTNKLLTSDVEAISENQTDFSLGLITHLHKIISMFLIVLVKLWILTVTMMMFQS